MKATREAYGEALKELAKNERVVVLDADLSGSTKTSEFKKVCPERFFNMGIAEQNLMGTAAGLAASGKIPFASTFAVFATGRAYEIIRNSICYPNLNVKVVATHAGLTVGEDGASHQMLEDLSLMRGLPNMTVISPADYNETISAIKAVAEMEGPVYVRLGRSKVPEVTDGKFEIGKSRTMKEGSDITIAATGVMVSRAMEAHDILKEKGISARVINFSTIKPIDRDAIIKAAKETKGIITAEEHSIIGGLGSAVAEVISENHPTRLKRIGVKDAFGRSGDGFALLDYYGLGVKDIVEAAMEWGE